MSTESSDKKNSEAPSVLEAIAQGPRGKVLAVQRRDANGDKFFPVVQELEEIGKTRPGEIQGIKDLFRRFAVEGRSGLTREQLHHANKEEDIWRIRKGRTRVYGYFEGNNLVLSGAALKKAQEADLRQVKAAAALRALLKNR